MNDTSPGASRFCKVCHHRADLARGECDCLMCEPRGRILDLPDVDPLIGGLDFTLDPDPEIPDYAGQTCGVKINGRGDRLGTASLTVSDAGACLVAGDHDQPETKVTVEWERDQLVSLVCTMLPYLTHVELMRVAQ